MPKPAHYPLLILALLVCIIATILISTGMGYIHIPVGDVFQIILAKIFGGHFNSDINQLYPVVITDVRLPRILTATIVGCGLAIAGVIFQAILLNPLADPYTLGVSSGAAFGAALALVLNISMLGNFSVGLFAFAGAITTLFAVLYLSSVDGRYSSNTLILSGVIVAAILSAGIGFIKHLADEKVSVIIFWLMGSFASKTWSDVCITLFFAIFAFVIAMFYSRDLNIMSLGVRTSDSLGVDTVRTRKIMLTVASLITAVCVSVSGIIGFIGLIIPHLMRHITGPDNRKLIPASGLAGGILLLLADTISRAVLPSEVPIGVLTALVGGPVFCYIFRQKQLGRKQ